MRIIVVGLGKVGQIITKYLADEGHDVIVIDKNFNKVEEVVDNYDVMGINGNGANNDVLKEATVDQADIVIAVTTSDELNILVGLLSKKLGAQHCIVRVRNPDYSNQRQFLQESLGFSMVINPEFEAANEIRRMILFPSALKVELFAGGMVEMVEFVVKKGCPLIESPLSDINKFTKSNVLISAVKTKDNVVIPIGENDSLKINAIKSLSRSNSQLIDTDYIIIQRDLLKPQLQELWVKLRGQARINWWIKDERVLREEM